jgi:hypothetical protein
MVYLEADSAKDLIRNYSAEPAELDRMARLINAVWDKIINLDFPDISKYPPDAAGIASFEEDLLNGN